MTQVRQKHVTFVGSSIAVTSLQPFKPCGPARPTVLKKPVETEPLISAMSELLDQIDTQSDDSAAPLTRMETRVLQYILQGRRNRQIAEALHRSPRTIEVHRRHIMRKLGAPTIVDLVRAAAMMHLDATNNGGRQA